MGAEVAAWSRFIEQCVLKRKTVEDFESLAKVQSSKSPITSSELAQLLSKPQSSSSPFSHPLIPRYVERLIQLNRLEIHDVLLTSLEFSPYTSDTEDSKNSVETSKNRTGPPNVIGSAETSKDLQLDILHRIARILANGPGLQGARLWKTIRAIARWMSSIAVQGAAPSPDESAVQVAVGTMFPALVGCETVSRALATSIPEGTYSIYFLKYHCIELFNRAWRFGSMRSAGLSNHHYNLAFYGLFPTRRRLYSLLGC